jgi:hypothetical protein
MRVIGSAPSSVLMIEASRRLGRPNSGPCSQIEKLFASCAADIKKAAVGSLRRDKKPSRRSRKTDDNSLRQNESLARIEAELDISIVEHDPFRVAVGDELTDSGHDERFIGVGVDSACNCPGRDLGDAKPVSLRLGVGH